MVSAQERIPKLLAWGAHGDVKGGVNDMKD